MARFAYFKQIGIGIGFGVAVLALMIGGLSLADSPKPQPSEQAISSQTPSDTPTPEPTPTGGTCSVAKQAADPNLVGLQARVVDSATMQPLYDVNGSKPGATASALKLLTATVAFTQLGPNYTVKTKVYRDATDPSVIYLVGAGDPTLSRVDKSVYSKAPKLNDLAASTITALGGGAVSKIIVDSSLFGGVQWHPSWETSERKIGYMSQVSALQVDGDRDNPTKETSPRSTTPELRAGNWFAKAIGDQAVGAAVELGTKPASATELASVTSQPISTWIAHMLKVSDNTEAEALARLVSLKMGQNGSFDSLDLVYKQALTQLGLSTAGLQIMDGSGLSDFNQVPPAFFIQLIKQISDGRNGLEIVDKDLTVSGKTGSLAYRFKGANRDAVGAVHAKTGWIKHGYTLAGYVDAKDGSRLLFAVYSLGKVTANTPAAIDTLVTGFYRCGLQLSNN